MNRSKRATHFGTICVKRMAAKRRFDLERSSWYDATFHNGTPVEIKSTMIEHSDGQPGTFTVYRRYQVRLRQANGRFCLMVYLLTGRMAV